MKKRILFLTGTRADFGKLKPLIEGIQNDIHFECHTFVTGMHMIAKYGYTLNEVKKAGFENIFTFMNQVHGESMEMILSNTIAGLSRYLYENLFDLIVVHGDRIEALAGAIVGVLRNVLVAHVEGGEMSGTADEIMRHAISKMANVHFVCNKIARKRLLQLGENPERIFVIGSPDVDVMLSDKLPSINEAKKHYGITFSNYGIAILHPVTTEISNQAENAKIFSEAIVQSQNNYIIIYPNNDNGSEYIFNEYKKLEAYRKIKIFPSLRFEYFLTLLKSANFIIGNSSAGIHEAPIYAVPTINIGNRQHKRFQCSSIFNVEFNKKDIIELINNVKDSGPFNHSKHYGRGNSAEKFISILKSDLLNTSNQKYFNELRFEHDK